MGRKRNIKRKINAQLTVFQTSLCVLYAQQWWTSRVWFLFMQKKIFHKNIIRSSWCKLDKKTAWIEKKILCGFADFPGNSNLFPVFISIIPGFYKSSLLFKNFFRYPSHQIFTNINNLFASLSCSFGINVAIQSILDTIYNISRFLFLHRQNWLVVDGSSSSSLPFFFHDIQNK